MDDLGMAGRWPTVELRTLSEEKPKTLLPMEYPEEIFEYYSIPAFQEGDIPLAELGKNILSNKIVARERTVLFGKLNPRVLKVWLTQKGTNYRKITSTEFLPIFVPGNVDEEFVYFMCHSSIVVREAERLVSGSTPSRQRVDPSAFYHIRIPLPQLEEQRAISRTLRTVRDAHNTRQRELKLERERKAVLMQHLFTYGTRNEPLKQTKIGEIPESWRVSTLSEVARIERGKFSHRPRNDPAFYGGNIPFIQTGDVTGSSGRIHTYSQTLNERGLSVSKIFPSGTIVITIAANIGYTGILEFDCAFPDSLIGITPVDGVDAKYLHYYLTTQQPEMDRKAPRGTQKNINIEFLLPWPILLPEPEEQLALAAIIAACDDKIRVLQRETALLDELFRATLEELMSGRLSVAPLLEAEAVVP